MKKLRAAAFILFVLSIAWARSESAYASGCGGWRPPSGVDCTCQDDITGWTMSCAGCASNFCSSFGGYCPYANFGGGVYQIPGSCDYFACTAQCYIEIE